MKDSCPTVHVPMPATGKPAAPVVPIRANNIVKWLMRKKVVMDLARLIHHLDLAGPHTVNTINAILKPLEELTRMINMPAGSVFSPQKSGRTQRNGLAASENERTAATISASAMGVASREWESDDLSRLSAGGNLLSAQTTEANVTIAANVSTVISGDEFASVWSDEILDCDCPRKKLENMKANVIFIWPH